jgi:hypothetical protein
VTQRESTVLQILAEGFSAPLVGLCALAGVLVALAGRESPAAGPAPSTTERVVKQPGTGAPDEAPAETTGGVDEALPARPAAPAEVEELLAQGEFARAERWARASGPALEPLALRAQLYEALTRGIKPGPLAGKQLLRVTTLQGDVVLGAATNESADRLTLMLTDGRERTLQRAQLRQREPLSPDAARRALDDALRRERGALGVRPPGLALHRLAHQAFASSLRPLGAQLLVEALRTPEGQIIVDMFGTGDVDRLHAARRALLGLPPAEPVGPVAALPEPTRPDPRPEPTRPDPRPDVPEPEPEPLHEDPEPEPDPGPAQDPLRPDQRPDEYRPPVPAGSLDAIFDHPNWGAADTAYRTGLQLYRSSFDSALNVASPSIRAALAQFRQAQDLLDRLCRVLPDAADSHEVERRVVELNALVLDCTKRLGTD